MTEKRIDESTDKLFDGDEDETDDRDTSLEDLLQDVGDDSQEDPEDEEPEAEPEPEADPELESAKPEEIVNVKVTRPRRKRQPKIGGHEATTSQDLDDYIEGLDPGSSTRIGLRLNRVEPTHFAGESVDGFIERFDRKITVEEIKKIYGGGTYDLVFFGPKPNGRGNKYITSKRIKISGDPIIRTVEAKKGDEDPGIVKLTLGTQDRMLENQEKKIEAERDRADRMMEMLTTRNDSPNEAIPLLMQMMQQQQSNSLAQLEATKEENRRREEENHRREERAERARLEDRKEMEQKSKTEMLPMMTFMVEQMKMSESKSKESAEMMKTVMASQQAMMAETFKTQMDMQNQASSQQVEFMKLQMSSIRDELTESRKNNNTDMVSMLLKMKEVKTVLAEVTGETESSQTTLDKVMDRIPEISEGVAGVAATLFAGMKPKTQAQIAAPQIEMPRKIQVEQAPPMQAPPMQAPPAPSEEAPPLESETPAATAVQNIEYPADPKEALAVMIIKITDAFSRGVEASEFVKQDMIGKIDRDMLIQLSGIPPFAVVQNVCSNLEDDHPLQDVAGKAYIKEILASLKEELEKEG